MQTKPVSRRGLAVLADLYLDRLIFVVLILAALLAGGYVHSL